MTLASDSFSRGSGPSAPGRGLGAEERAARTLQLAEGVFERNAERVERWAKASELAWPDELPRALLQDAAWLERAKALYNRHLKGLALVYNQLDALQAAKACRVPHQRQMLVYAIPVDLATAEATAFLEELQALTRDGKVEYKRAPAPAGPAPRPAPAGPRPAAPAPPAKPAGGGIAGFLQRLAAPRPEAPAAPAADEGPGLQLLAKLEGQLDEVRKLYKYTADRMVYVENALHLRAHPPAPGETPLPDAAPKAREMVVQLTRLFERQPPLLQRCQVAASQTTAVRRELLLIEPAFERLRAAPPAKIPSLADTCDIGGLRGKAVPLANFPRTFQADPILRQLFPPVK